MTDEELKIRIDALQVSCALNVKCLELTLERHSSTMPGHIVARIEAALEHARKAARAISLQPQEVAT